MKNFLKRQVKLMRFVAILFRLSMIGMTAGYGLQFAKVIVQDDVRGVSLIGFAVLVINQVVIMLHGWVNLEEKSYLILVANIIFCVGIMIRAYNLQ